MEINYALRFDFETSNNEAEYKALISSMKMGKTIDIKKLLIKSNSQLVTHQVREELQTREDNIKAYLNKVKELKKFFVEFEIE